MAQERRDWLGGRPKNVARAWTRMGTRKEERRVQKEWLEMRWKRDADKNRIGCPPGKERTLRSVVVGCGLHRAGAGAVAGAGAGG